MNELTDEEKEMNKKQIEGFKEKIYWELQNYDTNVLVFGNDRIASCCGDINDVVFKIACMIEQLHKQSGIRRKELLKGIKEMLRTLDNVKKIEQ